MTCLHGGFKHKMIHHPHHDQDKDAKLLKKLKLERGKKKEKEKKSAFKYVNSTEFYKFTNSRSPASLLYSGLNLNHK